MTDIAKLGLEVDTAGLLEGVRKLNELAEAAEATGKEAGKLEAQHLRQSKAWMEQAVLTGKTTDEVIRYRIALNEMTGDAAASANMIANGIKQRREEAEAIKRVADEQKRLQEEYKTSSAAQFGELVDMLAGKLIKLATAFLSVGTAMKAIKDFAAAEEVSNKLATMLEITGNRAGRTAEQIEELAGSLQQITRFDDESIKRASTTLVRMGQVAGDSLDRATKLSLDLAEAMGSDAASAAQMLGRAMETAYGAQMLRRQGYLTEEQAKQIKNLKELNRDAEAQEALFKALESRIGGVAEKMGERGLGSAFKQLTNQLGESSEGLGQALANMLGLEERIRALTAAVTDFNKDGGAGIVLKTVIAGILDSMGIVSMGSGFDYNASFAAGEKSTRRFEQGIDNMREPGAADKSRDAATLAQLKEITEARNREAESIDRIIMKDLKKKEGIQSLADLQRVVHSQFLAGNSLLIDSYGTEAAAVKALSDDLGKNAGTRKNLTKEVNDQLQSMAKQAELVGKTTEYEKLLWETQKGKYKDVSQAQKDALLNKAKELEQLQKEQEQLKYFGQLRQKYAAESKAEAAALQKAVAETAKAQADMVASTYKNAEALKEEAKTLGMTSEELMTYREETLKAKIAASEQEGGIWQLTDALKEQLAAEQALNDAKRQKARGDALAKEASDAAAAWKQSAESISNSLTDALLRGFESGADFAKNFRDTLVNMFKTMVLKPVIQFILSPISNAMGSVFGGLGNLGRGAAPGMAGAGGFDLSSLLGGGGGSSLLGYGGLSGLFSGSGGIFGAGAIGNSFALGSVGQALGLSAPGLDALGGMALTGLGTTMGAALPILGVALAAYMMFKKPRGGPKTGGYAQTGLPDLERYFTPNQKDADLQSIVDAQQSAYTQTLSRLGGRGTAGFAFGYDTDPQGTASDRVRAGVSVNGQMLYDTGNIETGRDDAATQKRLELEAKRALIAALKASDLPADIAKIFDQVDIAGADSQLLDRVLTVSEAVSSIAGMFTEVEEGATRIPAEVQAILDSVNLLTDPQVDVDRVIGVATAFASIYDLFNSDVLEDGLQAYNDSLIGANIAVQRGIASVYDLVEAYDGSADSAANLATATNEVYQASVQAIAQIEALKTSIGSMFSNAATDYRMASMSPTQQRAYLQGQITSDAAALETATDINEITRLAQQINANQQRLWGILSPEERVGSGNAFAESAEATNTIAQRQLNDARRGLELATTTLLGEVRQTFTQAGTDLSSAAASLSASAATQQTAADTQNDAATIQRNRADIPLKIIVSDERIEVQQ